MSEPITKYVDVTFDGTSKQTVSGVYQYDHGLYLRVSGVPTNVQWQLQFTNRGDVDSITVMGTVSGGKVLGEIPDALLMQQREIICYLYYEDVNYGITVYEIYIPLARRVKPAVGTYTPQQVDTFDTLAANLQALIDNFP